MVGLLKCDLLKAKKELSLFIIAIVSIAFALITAITYKILLSVLDSMNESETPAGMGEALQMLQINGKGLFLTSFSITNNIGLVIPIGICIYASKDFSVLTMHNKLIAGKPRYQVYLSTFISSCLIGTILIVIYSLLSLLFGSLILGYGTAFTMNEFLFILKVYGLGILIYLVFVSLIVLVVYIFKNTAISCVVYVISMLVLSIGLSIISSFAQIEIISNIYSCTVFSQMNDLILGNISNEMILKTIISSIVVICLTNAIGIYIFNKADIK